MTMKQIGCSLIIHRSSGCTIINSFVVLMLCKLACSHILTTTPTRRILEAVLLTKHTKSKCHILNKRMMLHNHAVEDNPFNNGVLS
jgi:hypothetical protein